jgi:hypothetical protein
LVFTDGAAHFGGATERRGMRQPDAESIPEKYRSWLGTITAEKTIPQIKQFVESGGSVVAIGSSTSMAQMLGVSVSSYLMAIGKDEQEHPLTAEQFYIPGSLLKTHIDNTDPLAYGMPDMADVLFDNSPVFKLRPDAESQHIHSAAWYQGPNILHSGWAWGETHLDGEQRSSMPLLVMVALCSSGRKSPSVLSPMAHSSSYSTVFTLEERQPSILTRL